MNQTSFKKHTQVENCDFPKRTVQFLDLNVYSHAYFPIKLFYCFIGFWDYMAQCISVTLKNNCKIVFNNLFCILKTYYSVIGYDRLLVTLKINVFSNYLNKSCSKLQCKVNDSFIKFGKKTVT